MASRQVLLLAAAAIAAAFLLAPASAEVFMVGDTAGWTLKYPATLTDSKNFVVGDSLMFMYPADKHNVMEVGGADFRACNVTGNAIGTWNSGTDTVTLDKAGRRWFICSVGPHCSLGMKLLVTVVDATAQAPASPPSSSASFLSGAVSQAMTAAGTVAAAVLML
ncbi:hypothetical protein ACQ4PT_054313 [Festuca glaucescens]